MTDNQKKLQGLLVKSKNDAVKPAAGAVQRQANAAKDEPKDLVNITFRVPADFKRDMKIEAANLGITQTELLMRIFRERKSA